MKNQVSLRERKASCSLPNCVMFRSEQKYFTFFFFSAAYRKGFEDKDSTSTNENLFLRQHIMLCISIKWNDYGKDRHLVLSFIWKASFKRLVAFPCSEFKWTFYKVVRDTTHKFVNKSFEIVKTTGTAIFLMKCYLNG